MSAVVDAVEAVVSASGANNFKGASTLHHLKGVAFGSRSCRHCLYWSDDGPGWPEWWRVPLALLERIPGFGESGLGVSSGVSPLSGQSFGISECLELCWLELSVQPFRLAVRVIKGSFEILWSTRTC